MKPHKQRKLKKIAKAMKKAKKSKKKEWTFGLVKDGRNITFRF